MNICTHCNMNVEIRNPSGFCDHLYYPDYCEVCKDARRTPRERLNFAAPDLLEALEEAMSDMGAEDSVWHEKAVAAISKAKGQL